jgi:hypothetical protein
MDCSRELCAISLVPGGERPRPPDRIVSEGHVVASVDALACSPVELPALAFDLRGVGRPGVVLVVQDQPEFETRIRNGEADVVCMSQMHSLR